MDPLSHAKRILRLPQDVVNRIAAGEVVCRPSAALKELLENSLDAGATSIAVTVREGGLKLLQVSDDGKGIAYEDLPLLCERFATSKISSYEDLQTVATFGFRGEALASMSHVSRLTVLTKIRDSTVAYKASYLSGSLREAPEPTASADGTTITLEEMFYNLPTRRRALKSSSDEYRLVLDVVTRYAIHYPQVAFLCKRQQSGSASRIVSTSDLRTEMSSSTADNIRTGFGSTLSHETVSFEITIDKADASVSAIVSTANYNMKKGTFILFINGRLVECQPFKRAVWALYGNFLPKNSFPFVYAALKMKPDDIDVNVHPTKKEVRFLHEQVIIDSFVDELGLKLKGTETSRTFLAQSVITLNERERQPQKISSVDSAPVPPHINSGKHAGTYNGNSGDSTTKSKSDKFLRVKNFEAVRNEGSLDNSIPDGVPLSVHNDLTGHEETAAEPGDCATNPVAENAKRTKQTFIQASGTPSFALERPRSSGLIIRPKDKVRTGANAPVGLYDVFLTQNFEHAAVTDIQGKRQRRQSSMPLLTSVENLLQEARRSGHKGLSQILKDHLFVGVASPRHVLLQHGTKLLLADIDRLLVELTYQQVLKKFGDLDMFQLNPPGPVSRILNRYALGLSGSNLKGRIDVESCLTVLMEKTGMLSEYFGIGLRGEGPDSLVVEKLPLPFPGVIPDLKLLGKFLYHLVLETDWSVEEACFRDVARQIAEWYGKGWETLPGAKGKEDNESDGGKVDSEGAGIRDENGGRKGSGNGREWVLRHVLFASMRCDFHPPRRFFIEEVVREVTSTSRLYRVFERC